MSVKAFLVKSESDDWWKVAFKGYFILIVIQSVKYNKYINNVSHSHTTTNRRKKFKIIFRDIFYVLYRIDKKEGWPQKSKDKDKCWRLCCKIKHLNLSHKSLSGPEYTQAISFSIAVYLTATETLCLGYFWILWTRICFCQHLAKTTVFPNFKPAMYTCSQTTLFSCWRPQWLHF